MKTQQIKYLTDISKDKVTFIHKSIHPYSSFLLPSIIHLWYNKNNTAQIYSSDTYCLALLIPHESHPFWSLSTRTDITNDDLLQVKKIADAIYPVKEIRYTTITEKNSEEKNKLIKLVPEDVSYYDYIYSMEELSNCVGNKYEDTRRHVRRFFDLYGKNMTTKTVSSWLELQEYKQQAYDLFDDWTHLATEGSKDYFEEERALHLFFNKDTSELFGDLVVILFFYHNKMVGYSINEIYDSKYALNHFHKSNLNLSSIGHYTFYSIAVVLRQHGVEFLNFQEDCGIGGLRAFKHKMRPTEIFETKKIIYLTQ